MNSSPPAQQQRQQVTVKDLIEESKKRIVILLICVVGLSYLMSLTSSSVLINLPAAAALIILLRYFSLDFEMRRKAITYNSKPPPANTLSQKKPPVYPKAVDYSEWKKKVNSPVVEDAINQFTRHLVSEWVTDLWYARLTPDREGPEELVLIVNGVLGEISTRVKNVNLIDLLTRDLINLICGHLELFRATQLKIEKKESGSLTTEYRESELKRILAAENKLHPALFSAESEHKVLKTLMDGLMSFTFRPEDLQCYFFRYIARELLACAVMRPVLNLANPRFINERIEAVVISRTKANTSQELSPSKLRGSSKFSSDRFSRSLDPTGTGVELVQLKTEKPRTSSVKATTDDVNVIPHDKDPLLSIDTRSSRTWSSLPDNLQTSDQRFRSGGEWGDMLDLMSRRKTQALAPEHFENMWTKGRDYRKKDGENRFIEEVSHRPAAGKSAPVSHSKAISKPNVNNGFNKPSEIRTVHSGPTEKGKPQKSLSSTNRNVVNGSPMSYQDTDDEDDMQLQGIESGSTTSYTSEDGESDTATGIDSPGTKVWDGRSNRKTGVSHIHHPLENLERRTRKKSGRRHAQYQQLPRSHSGRKRSRLSSPKLPVWQEVERTSFLSGDGQDILSFSKGHGKVDGSSDDSETEILDRLQSGITASSSASFLTVPETHSLGVNSLKSSLMVDSLFKLKCEVLGANIVKSGSKTFAVYSISVTDVNNNSWSIKRRFRHFEELHRRLKVFPEYDLHLPPKHFLSTGLDVPVIRERCKLLDIYLKKLLQIPGVSGSIEVWDFLSVDSQTYIFSNSFSIVETLSVDLDDNVHEKAKQFANISRPVADPLASGREMGRDSKESVLKMRHNWTGDRMKSNSIDMSQSMVKNLGGETTKSFEDSGKNLSNVQTSGKVAKRKENDGLQNTAELFLDAASDPTIPSEWVPPNLSIPILDLVDVIFQLQDGGWIRRQAFWVAKQILHLGMGDAFDDWLIEKIQLLRKGPVVAAGIKRLEQILWPDGIFLTKHPKRRPQPNTSSPTSPVSPQPAPLSSPRLTEEQKEEADRRAKFVYELMIDKAPAAIVGLVGRKEYEQCAKDLYFFLQSSVFMKQLAYNLLELLLLPAFPEMEYIFKQLHDEKHRFGEYKAN